MRLVTRTRSVLILALALLGACGSPSPEQQMEQYLTFYYPATTDGQYDIVFDWGQLLITCEPPLEQAVHADSEPYRGYITLRPVVSSGKQLPAGIRCSLIEPDGTVWQLPDDSGVPASSEREEVVVEKDGGGTSTTTTTIRSVSEPLIDHFRAQPAAWQRYGQVRDGKLVKAAP